MNRVAVELAKFELEHHELELMLLVHFKKWKSHACECLNDNEIQQLDWIDEFTKDVRKELLKFKRQGKLGNSCSVVFSSTGDGK